MKIKVILLALIVFLAKVPAAQAISWSYNQDKNFDQIIVSNNTAKEKIETIRTDSNKILIQGKNFENNLQVIQGNMISNVIATEYGLSVVLKDNAFGFMQNTDNNGNIIIGIYKDPMGARWKPTAQRVNFNKQVSQKEETVKARLEEPKEEQKNSEQTENPQPSEQSLIAQNDTAAENVVQDEPALAEISQDNQESLPAISEKTLQQSLKDRQQSAEQTNSIVNTQDVQEEVLHTQITQEPASPRIVIADQDSIDGMIDNLADTSSRDFLAQFAAAGQERPVLIADATGNSSGNLIENAEIIKPDELLSAQQNQGTQQNQHVNPNTVIPSVTLKLNPGTPPGVPTITNEEIQSQKLEEQVEQKDTSKQTESPELIQKKEEEPLPLVIEDKTHDTVIASSPEELEVQNHPEQNQQTPQEPDEDGKVQQPGEIIYVDEEGNEVPAPLDIPATIQSMRKSYNLGIYETVFEETEKLKELNLPKNLLEEIFYNRAKAYFVMNSNNLKNAGETFISIAQEALNANDESSRKPELLANLVATYIELDRPAEARAYADILYKNYPYSLDTPNAILLVSDYLLKHQDYTIATQYLQILIDKYPDNTYAKNAAMLQIKALHKLGNYDRTLAMINFIDRRWPKVYLEFPDYLVIKAHILEEQGLIRDAISTYWQIFNLNPKDEQAGDILFKIANLYYDIHLNDSAKKVLEQLYQGFPQHKSAPKALLYMGENGRFDDRHTVDEIIEIYNEPNPEYPATYYNKIINEYPDSKEALTATLRSAILKYIEKDYLDAAALAQNVFTNNIDTREVDTASELLHRAFDPIFQLSLSEQNYERTLILWESFPAVHHYYEPISSLLRLSLAKAHINRNETAEAESLLSYFLERIPTNETEYQEGIYAYDIFLAHAINTQDWSRVLETNKKIDSWRLPTDKENNKKYTTAIAAENLGLEARALPFWRELAANESIPLYQRAYAQYFLARDAERKQNIRGAYQANLDALAMFEDLRNVQSPYASPERESESIAALMDITEIAGRFTESLEWLNRYRNYVSENSKDYAGLQLREARLHRKMGDTMRWRSILEDVRRREPESIYGKMASSELNTYEMARDLTRFTGNN